ncbi:anti-sigma factor [Burkholderia sp. L27(2015)]|uniref:anti-sigma factor family protein n=1 Tax=Burkholderia sp. L27(2015) TaxID=1641858 RepID=UPI00131B5A22|nr:anti-sigma factor [Burkholderia sp. L27(2015)]
MNHEQALELLPGYLDEELSLSEALEFQRHLDSCGECSQVLAQHRDVSAQLRSAQLRMDAPPELVKRIEAALPGRSAPWARLGERFKGQDNGNSRNVGSRWLTWPTWATAGVMVASVAALSVSMSLYLAVPSSEDRLTQEVVDDHIRSLQFNHLSDVISTDKHTVKPWFNGKLDFAPPVIDLVQQGYPLIGGRLDYVDGRAVAVMVYRYKLHPINLYVWPSNGTGIGTGTTQLREPAIHERQGYHFAHWSAGGMTYWAITDAGEDELHGFVTDLRGQLSS